MVKQLQTISRIPHVVQALVAGTSHLQGYEYEASATSFVVEKITGWTNERGVR
jgi:hypothetical protein